ncbi:DoxX family protein [Rhizobium halophytocola]|uniref:DoxX family protein n=1 Tax=Rhizobium halophytocola TaxID=735519 RepID=A0ABS4E1G3_9HYPH|nr:DoxX family protein [Rhizobium halophytocola]MBP1851785.1 hypothetical protein [Rhizobium halophytocola]
MKTTFKMRSSGRVLSGLFVVFMLGASVTPKLMGFDIAEQTLQALGWPPGYAFGIGCLELLGTLLYLFPSTSLFGAVLLTGLFGATIATHLRVESPLFSHTLFGLYLAGLMWGGLWLRDSRVRTLLPLMKGDPAE